MSCHKAGPESSSWEPASHPLESRGPQGKVHAAKHDDAAAAAPIGVDRDGDRRATCPARATQLATREGWVRSECEVLWEGARNAGRKRETRAQACAGRGRGAALSRGCNYTAHP